MPRLTAALMNNSQSFQKKLNSTYDNFRTKFETLRTAPIHAAFLMMMTTIL